MWDWLALNSMSTAGQSDGVLDGVPVVKGAIVGVVTFVVAYVATGVLTAVATRDSNADVSALEGIGWYFYGAHYVEFVNAGVALPLWSDSSIPQVAFTALVIVVLFGAGFVLTRRYTNGSGAGEGVKAGTVLVLGYLPLVLVDVLVVRDAVAEMPWELETVPAIVLAGIAFPLVLGTIGGIVAALTR